VTEELLAWLRETHGPLGYLVLAAAAAIEYVFPPFPGDTITLGGIALALGSGYGVGWVYVAMNAGALAGGMTAYAAGLGLARRRERTPPRFLRSMVARRAIDSLLVRFQKHGAAYLALNRFIPAFRAFFFLAAGMARLPAWKVAAWGTLSAMVWNALLLGIGVALGENIELLGTWVSRYSYGAIAVAAVVVIVWLWRWRKSEREAEEAE
jgi:membrane protein DedA with SNARE-associated domain